MTTTTRPECDTCGKVMSINQVVVMVMSAGSSHRPPRCPKLAWLTSRYLSTCSRLASFPWFTPVMEKVPDFRPPA